MIGEKLGSYQIEAILGSGAMGVVYRAVHEATGKAAALKVISGEGPQKGKNYERFEREATILRQFRHDNIVRFFAVGRYKGTSYIAMEFVQGRTLEQALEADGPFSWRDAVDLSIQTCEALHYAHQHGVVHRDLKPSNLMLTESGKIKLTDFGIAKDLDATALTATGRTMGTAAYMAPEQIRGNPAISHKTDLYSLGVVMYQMLAGRTPFEGSSAVVLMHGHLNDPPPRPSSKVQEIPRALDDLIVKLMAKAPGDRPWDAAAVSYALSELRDKASRSETIKMAWPSTGSLAPTQAAPTGGGAAAAPVSISAAKVKKSRKAAKPSQSFGIHATRETLEVALLVVALVAVGGGIGYALWPPSAGYLFRRAEALMASKSHADWITARDDFIEPLDKRFPRHKYRDQTRAWLDSIVLSDTERRAARLDSPIKVAFNEPQTAVEHQYVAFSKLARESSEAGDDVKALRRWEEFANQLKPDDREEHPWSLLAKKRIDDLTKVLTARREAVTSQLHLAVTKELDGRPDEAKAIRQHVWKEYGSRKDLADLLPPAANPERKNPPKDDADEKK